MPEDPSLLLHVKETSANNSLILLPRPEEPFQMGAYYQFQTSSSNITPPKIKCPKIVPKFFKVHVEEHEDKFKMELICVDDGACMWKDEFQILKDHSKEA